MNISATQSDSTVNSAAQPQVELLDCSISAARRAANERIIEWFSLWHDPVRAWLRHRAAVPSAELDDLAQEVFVRLLRYSEDIVVHNPHGYLLRIAKNVAHEWRQRSRVRHPHASEWLDDLRLEPEEEPENALARTRAQQRIRDIVNRLPARQRELLVRYVSSDLTYQQIARERGLTYRIVLRDLCRAYATLREELRSEEF